MPRPGDPMRVIRMPDEMWDALAAAIKEAEPELERAKVVREFVRWYIGETDELPRRPMRKQRKAGG